MKNLELSNNISHFGSLQTGFYESISVSNDTRQDIKIDDIFEIKGHSGLLIVDEFNYIPANRVYSVKASEATQARIDEINRKRVKCEHCGK